MLTKEPKNTGVLIAGDRKESITLFVCLLKAGHKVCLITSEKEQALNATNQHIADLESHYKLSYNFSLDIKATIDTKDTPDLAIIITDEDIKKKREAIAKIQEAYQGNVNILINSESITLSDIQGESDYPQNIMIVNWSEPVHTTLFMELVANERNDSDTVANLEQYARKYWEKDPYTITGELGVRSQMQTAMLREAFYLVQNGYASIEDIDRACRNDPGYYLPFAGNFRYMDLMGTAAYGMVMKDLNPELSNETELPDFFQDILNQDKEYRKLYNLTEEQDTQEEEKFRQFSYEIKDIIDKYPAL